MGWVGDYVRATQAAHRLGRQMAAFHVRHDVLLTPGLATLPPRLGWLDMMMEDVDEYWRRVFTFNTTARRTSSTSRVAPPYPEQETEELGDDVIARLNPETGDVESLEVLFFSTRLLGTDLFELPVTADLHRAD